VVPAPRNIIVETADGDANICGDVIYDINDQIVEPFHEIGDMEPRVTGNHGTTKRQEKAAIKRCLRARALRCRSTTGRREE
jgi:hypothetical protein